MFTEELTTHIFPSIQLELRDVQWAGSFLHSFNLHNQEICLLFDPESVCVMCVLSHNRKHIGMLCMIIVIQRSIRTVIVISAVHINVSYNGMKGLRFYWFRDNLIRDLVQLVPIISPSHVIPKLRNHITLGVSLYIMSILLFNMFQTVLPRYRPTIPPIVT